MGPFNSILVLLLWLENSSISLVVLCFVNIITLDTEPLQDAGLPTPTHLEQTEKFVTVHINYFALGYASLIVLHKKLNQEWIILIPLSQFLLGEVVAVKQRASCHNSIVKIKISRVGKSSTVAGRGNGG